MGTPDSNVAPATRVTREAGPAGGVQADGVWTSTDGAESWQRSGAALNGIPVMGLATDGRFVYAGTDGMGVWKLRVTDALRGDLNGDGLVNFFDIDPFIACLFAGCP